MVVLQRIPIYNPVSEVYATMTQTEQVIDTMKRLGGVATFGKLNSEVDFSSWETKTPEASVRRIVQNSSAFFRLRPGLWALKEYENEVLSRFNLGSGNETNEIEFSHTYFQGLVVEVGNYRGLETFVPNQDKNKDFIGRPLREVAQVQDIYQFSYTEIVNRAKTIDVIWFNDRRMPSAFFEIEHSTDIQNSLLKYFELQDFNADFYIVADAYRHNKFNEIISRSVFKPIKERVKFRSYEALSIIHDQVFRQTQADAL